MKTLLATGAALAALALSLPLAAQSTLREVSSFDSIEDEEERAQAIFREMARVITHPRCMNCHPVDNSPRQGDAMAMHQPPVVRYDEAGLGVPGLQCTSCHGAENVAYATGDGSVPGHEHWHLAPASMGWTGLTVGEICQQIQDPERNGGRTLAEVQEHHAQDGLVGWAWEPGEGRTPPPGNQALFGDLTQAWVEAGAHCPS